MNFRIPLTNKRIVFFSDPYSYRAYGWMNSWHYVPGRVGFHGRVHISAGLYRIGFYVS